MPLRKSSSRYDVGTAMFGVLTAADENRMWSVRMGDVRAVVYADDYETAVREFEAFCIEQGIERRGADFLKGRLHDIGEGS